jgi:hypothetical protein
MAARRTATIPATDPLADLKEPAMTRFDTAWAAAHDTERRRLAETGMFREEDEHAS